MADVNERKTPEEIKQRIVEALNKRPLNAQEISKEINSNWSTVKNYVDELIEEKKVKEIIATDKISYYQKITETYYNIPITKEQEDLFKFLFSSIIQEYKKNNRLPRKTDLAKDSVDVINELKLELPTAWYIYGQIPLMIPDPTKEFSTTHIPKKAEEIRKSISNLFKKNSGMKVREREQNHYIKYNNYLYQIKEKLLGEISLMEDEKKIISYLSEFYIKCPISDFPEIFNLTERLYLLINKLNIIQSLKHHKLEIVLSLDALWKFIASYQLLDSISKNPQYNKNEIFQFNLGSAIETKKYCAEETISNLESIYLSELPNKEFDISEEAKEVREIMSDWDGE
jgi:predicted transcriptional regulator